MAAPKIVPALLNYDPQPAPLADADVKRYLSNELGAISSRLNVLAETFMPNCMVALTNISHDIVIPVNPIFTAMDDYDLGIGSDYLDYTGMVFDPVTGIIAFDGSPNELITVEITGNFTFTRGTLGFNESVFMRVNDLTAPADFPFAAAYVATNLQNVFSLNGSIVLEISGDAALLLSISADVGGTVSGALGSFTVRPITNKYLVRPNG